MGKIKKKARLHNKAVHIKKNTDNRGDRGDMVTPMETTGSADLAKSSSLGGGVFSKLDIDINALQRRLGTDDDDTRSAITSKSLKGLNINKKDKQKLRHQLWLKKVATLEMVKKETAARKRRQKTAIVGDLKPLEDTLPTLDLLLKDCATHQHRLTAKVKGVKKEKVRQKESLQDISVFKQVLNHQTYRDNPLATIKEHLQNRMAQENS